jgi:excisionase family DNA binding protein
MYSPQEAATALNVCRRTILRRIADKSIPAVKVGTRDWRIKESDLVKCQGGATEAK